MVHTYPPSLRHDLLTLLPILRLRLRLAKVQSIILLLLLVILLFIIIVKNWVMPYALVFITQISNVLDDAIDEEDIFVEEYVAFKELDDSQVMMTQPVIDLY